MPNESRIQSILKALRTPDQYTSVGRLAQVEDGGAMYVSPEGQLLDIPRDFAYQPSSNQVYEAARDPWERMTFLPVGRNRQTLEWSLALPDIVNRARTASQKITERGFRGLTTTPSNVQSDINAIGNLTFMGLPLETAIIKRTFRNPPGSPPTPPTTPINPNYRTRPMSEYITPRSAPSGGVQGNINPRTGINEIYNPSFSPYTPGSNTGFMPTARNIVQSGAVSPQRIMPNENAEALAAMLRILRNEGYPPAANMNIQGIRPIK